MQKLIIEWHAKGVSPAGITSLLMQAGLCPHKTNYYGLLKIVKNCLTGLKSGKAAERASYDEDAVLQSITGDNQ